MTVARDDDPGVTESARSHGSTRRLATAAGGTAGLVSLPSDSAAHPWPATRFLGWSLILIVACSLASVGLGQTRPELYAAQAHIVVVPGTNFSDALVERVLVTEQVLLTSPSVLGPVAEDLGLTTSELQERLSTTVDRQESLVLRLTLLAGSPRDAADQLHAVMAQFEPVPADYGAGTSVTRRFLGPFPLPGRQQPQPLRDLALGLFAGCLLAAAMVLLQVKLRPAFRALRRRGPEAAAAHLAPARRGDS